MVEGVKAVASRRTPKGVAGFGTCGGKALTGTGRATYHRAMQQRAKRRAALGAGCGLLAVVWLCGCEDAAKKPVQAKVPAMGPVQPQKPDTPAVAELPQRKMAPEDMASLLPAAPDGIPYLIEQVKAKFASGEANYKAGHLAAARRDFDDAVDWMLESGYDPNSDPKLRELFQQVTDKVYTYELQAFRAGDGFTEAPAVPAAIDEVAEMTFPVDPKLKERAEDVAKNVSHDLPLTVNDVVVSYLNFFQTPRGRAIVENGLRRKGKYQEMIARVLREEGVPQDLIYLAQAESAFQPLALSRAGARGIWQFVQWRGNEYGLKRSWWVDERHGSGEGHARGGAAFAGFVRALWRLVSGDGGVQLRAGKRAKRHRAHRLRGLLGAVQPQRAADGDQELRADYSGADADRQGRARTTASPWNRTSRCRQTR